MPGLLTPEGLEAARLRHLETCSLCAQQERTKTYQYLISEGYVWQYDPVTRSTRRQLPFCESDMDALPRPAEMSTYLWGRLPESVTQSILEYATWDAVKSQDYSQAAGLMTINTRMCHTFWKQIRGAPRWDQTAPTNRQKASLISRYMYMVSHTYQMFLAKVVPDIPIPVDPESDDETDWLTTAMVPWISMAHPYIEYGVPVDPLRVPSVRKGWPAVEEYHVGLEPAKVKLSDFSGPPIVGWAGHGSCDVLVIDGKSDRGLVRTQDPPHPTLLMEIRNGNGRSQWKLQLEAWQTFAGFLSLGIPGLTVYIKSEGQSTVDTAVFDRIYPPLEWTR